MIPGGMQTVTIKVPFGNEDGTKVEIDGAEIKHLRRIHFDLTAGHPHVVTLEFFAHVEGQLQVQQKSFGILERYADRGWPDA